MGEEHVDWLAVRAAIDAGEELPRPPWLPPLGPGTVTGAGYEPVDAMHLGSLACLELRPGDMIGDEYNESRGEWTYIHIAKIASYRTHRVLSLDVGGRAVGEATLAGARLLTSVWRPTRRPWPIGTRPVPAVGGTDVGSDDAVGT